MVHQRSAGDTPSEWRTGADPESLVRGGPNVTFFLVYEKSKYHYMWDIIGPPAKRHWNGVSLTSRWWPNIECWLGSFVIFQVIRSSIAKKPYIFVIFSRGVRTPCTPPPPLWIRAWRIAGESLVGLHFKLYRMTLTNYYWILTCRTGTTLKCTCAVIHSSTGIKVARCRITTSTRCIYRRIVLTISVLYTFV